MQRVYRYCSTVELNSFFVVVVVVLCSVGESVSVEIGHEAANKVSQIRVMMVLE